MPVHGFPEESEDEIRSPLDPHEIQLRRISGRIFIVEGWQRVWCWGGTLQIQGQGPSGSQCPNSDFSLLRLRRFMIWKTFPGLRACSIGEFTGLKRAERTLLRG